jgi:hypothetical protein
MAIAPEPGMTAAEIKAANAAVNQARTTGNVATPVTPTVGTPLPASFNPTVTMPAAAVQPNEPGFVGPVAPQTSNPIVYGTKQIYDKYGTLVTIYTEGPSAGRDVTTGDVVVEGQAPEKSTTAPVTPPVNPAVPPVIPPVIPPSGSTGPTLARDVFKQTLAIYFGQTEANKPWMDELYNLANPLYKGGATMDEALNMALMQGRNNPKLADFTNRFKGLFDLQDAKVSGKAVNVPTIAEYYNAEAGMGSVLRQAGLADIATSDYLGTVIGKGLSVTDVGNYINNIYTEIQNLPADIKAQVDTHYPALDKVSLAKSILTGDKGFAQLQSDLNTYEIQGAGNVQGVKLNDTQARNLAGMGYNLNTATQGLGQVALAAPTYQRLSQYSGNTQMTETQAQQDLVDANMRKLASQQRRVEQEAAREAARFQGSSGTARGAFSTGYLNKQASSGAF